jgi:hypothetical protein
MAQGGCGLHRGGGLIMTTRLIFGECDACAKPNRVLRHAIVGGTETYACAPCGAGSLADDVDDIEAEIDRLKPMAETGAQWGHLCALEAALVEARECETMDRAIDAIRRKLAEVGYVPPR